MELTSAPSAERGCHVRFTNFDTTFSDDILRFGHSTKRAEIEMAGHFGEGGKVEINRLCASSATVIYRTGQQEWIFGYNSTHELGVRFLYLAGANAFSQVEVRNVPHSVLPTEDQYLFLTPAHDVVRLSVPSDLDGFSILLSPKHIGRCYVRGIPVPVPTGLLDRFGVDYTGHRKPAELGMGRDRASIPVEVVCELLTGTMASLVRIDLATVQCPHALGFATASDTPRDMHHTRQCRICQVADFRQRVLDSVFSGTHNTIAIHGCQRTRHAAVAATFAWTALQERHGAATVPVSEVDASQERASAELFNITMLPVRDCGLCFLQQSPQCRTLDKVRQEFAFNFCALPEFVAAGAEVVPFADSGVTCPSVVWAAPEAQSFFHQQRSVLVPGPPVKIVLLCSDVSTGVALPAVHCRTADPLQELCRVRTEQPLSRGACGAAHLSHHHLVHCRCAALHDRESARAPER
jgi:hypothetical protein